MIFTKKGFTLMEVLVIVVLIGLGLITVIQTINNSKIYLQKTRQKVIAINLAREGVEQMMNIRNTNRKRRAGEKEKTRLKSNPAIQEYNLTDDPRFGSGNYIIQTLNIDGQQFFYGIDTNQPLIIENGITGSNLQYSLCEEDGKWSACPGQIPQSNEGYFFRKIQGFGVFEKHSSLIGGNFIDCQNGESTDCGIDSAKEFRFCSIVEYIGNGVGKVELCSVLTNFEN